MQGSKVAAPGVVFTHTSQGDVTAANAAGGILMVDQGVSGFWLTISID